MKRIGTTTLETERLILRRFTIEDAKTMFNNWASDPEATKYLTWTTHKTIDDSKWFTNMCLDNYQDLSFYLPNLNYKDESSNKSPNKINKKISDLGLSILSLISNNPGIKVPEMFEIISRTDSEISIDKIRYSIKTELKETIELKGSKKTGGYYIK